MDIYYNNKLLKNRTFLSVNQTKYAPKIKLNVNANYYYTLILYDPDAVGGTHIHWAVINITSNDVATGDTIIKYKGPAPPLHSGKHRYIFYLYKQHSPNYVEKINNRIIEIEDLEEMLMVDKPLSKITFISENRHTYKIKKSHKKTRKRPG